MRAAHICSHVIACDFICSGVQMLIRLKILLLHVFTTLTTKNFNYSCLHNVAEVSNYRVQAHPEPPSVLPQINPFFG